LGNLSNYMEEDVLDTYIVDTDVYLAIFDNNATEAKLEEGNIEDEITEYDGNRPLCNMDFTDPVQQNGKATAESQAEIEYESMPATTIKFMALMTTDGDAEDGEILFWMPLDGGEEEITEGNKASVPAGDVVVDLD